jgi:hypothetical protein
MATPRERAWDLADTPRKGWAPEVPMKVRLAELWTERLEAAVRDGSLRAVVEALAKGADVNKREQNGRLRRSFILMAAEFGFLEILQRLLQEDCVVLFEECRRGYSVLTVAVRMQRIGVVKWLLSDEGNRASDARSFLKVDSSGRPTLSHAIPRVDGSAESETDTVMMKFLVHGGYARWDEVDPDGLGAFHWATRRQNKGAALLCLKEGFLNVEVRDHDGNTALLTAAKDARNDKMVEWCLKEGGADGLAKDNVGRGALALALQQGSANSVVCVLEAGLETMEGLGRTGKSGWDLLELRISGAENDDLQMGERGERSMGFHIGAGQGHTPLMFPLPRTAFGEEVMVEVARGCICRNEKVAYTVQLGKVVLAFCPLLDVLSNIVSEYAEPTNADMEGTGLPGSLTGSRQQVTEWLAAHPTERQSSSNKREGELKDRRPKTSKIGRKDLHGVGCKSFPVDLVGSSDDEEAVR